MIWGYCVFLAKGLCLIYKSIQCKGALTTMLNQVKKAKKESTGGFTIIEVMIVLAIAGLIMTIVFIAVPALQRNARTSQRNADASYILGAVNECLTNKNGIVGSCDQDTEIGVFLDTARLKALSTTITITTVGQTAPLTAAGAPIDTTWRVSYNTNCNADGSSATVVGNPRQMAIMYGVEDKSSNTIVRCISG